MQETRNKKPMSPTCFKRASKNVVYSIANFGQEAQKASNAKSKASENQVSRVALQMEFDEVNTCLTDQSRSSKFQILTISLIDAQIKWQNNYLAFTAASYFPMLAMPQDVSQMATQTKPSALLTQ